MNWRLRAAVALVWAAIGLCMTGYPAAAWADDFEVAWQMGYAALACIGAAFALWWYDGRASAGKKKKEGQRPNA